MLVLYQDAIFWIAVFMLGVIAVPGVLWDLLEKKLRRSTRPLPEDHTS
jgi:hypothetical protein